MLRDGKDLGLVLGVCKLLRSGKGFYVDITGVSYVTMVSRVRAVIERRHRKGPVSRAR